jgi:CBS domain-containing protein
MTTDVVTVGPDARVVEVAETLLATRISAVPVIGERGELVGIVSEGDLMRRSEARTERRRAWWLEAFGGRTALANAYVQANAQKVADIMTRNVVTATPDTPLGEIAALLERHHIKRVPVVRNGKVVGIVSRANLIQALASIRKKISIATASGDRPSVKTFWRGSETSPGSSSGQSTSSSMKAWSSYGELLILRRKRGRSEWWLKLRLAFVRSLTTQLDRSPRPAPAGA